jgi:hypothetical protein
MRDPTLNTSFFSLANLDSSYSQYAPQNIQQFFEAVFFDKTILYQYGPDNASLVQVQIQSLEDSLMKRSYLAQTGYTIRRLYILSVLYYFYYSIVGPVTNIYKTKAAPILIQLCANYLYQIFVAVPESLPFKLSPSGVTKTIDTLGCMMCYQVAFNKSYPLVINTSVLNIPAYVLATFSFANNLVTTAPSVVNYDPQTFNPGVQTLLFGLSNAILYNPYSITDIIATNPAININNYQSTYAVTIGDRIGLLLLNLSSFPFPTSRTTSLTYNVSGNDIFDLSDPPTLSGVQFLLRIVTTCYLGDADDITNLVEKNPNMLSQFSYGWNYTKVDTTSQYANNIDFLMRANVTVNGKIVRFVDYLAENADSNPYLQQINEIVVSNNIQNATNANSNQAQTPFQFVKALGNYYYRRIGIYPRVTLKTDKIISTGGNNLLTQRAIIYNSV